LFGNPFFEEIKEFGKRIEIPRSLNIDYTSRLCGGICDQIKKFNL